MTNLTQHQKILDFCSDGKFHCQNEFRANFIFSPHKRRSEITEKYGYIWENKPCEHGVKNQKDYRMVPKGQLNLIRL